MTVSTGNKASARPILFFETATDRDRVDDGWAVRHNNTPSASFQQAEHRFGVGQFFFLTFSNHTPM